MANVLFTRTDTPSEKPITDGQILFDTSGNGKIYLDNGTDRLEMGGAITVDASLSKTSTNAIQNKAVTGNILNSLAEVSAATQQNTIAGALALKEVNSSLTANSNQFHFDYKDGKYGFNTDPNRGADTFHPFSPSFNEIAFAWHGSNFGGGILKNNGTSLGGYAYGSTFNGDYMQVQVSQQIGTGATGAIAFIALRDGTFKIFDGKGNVTEKNVKANETIYSETMSNSNTPRFVIAL